MAVHYQASPSQKPTSSFLSGFNQQKQRITNGHRKPLRP